MKLNPDETRRLAAFPDVLRELIMNELAAGNDISGFSGSFPAPPVGDCVKLQRRVNSRLRESGDGIEFYDRNNSSHSGEFTDTQGFYFILEPPNESPPEVDMDAIRGGLRGYPPVCASKSLPQTAVDRFRESMVCNFERWHDGIGYDLEILKAATPEELLEIEELLISRGVNDWRDVEALAALDLPRARVLLRQTLKSGDRELAQAVSRYAPQLASGDERIATLVGALEETDSYAGLTEALLEVESFHPPEVIAALLRGVLERSGDHPCHFAAMLMFLHGQAETSFDWDQRPFFLRFNSADCSEREAMFRELCERIGISSVPYLKA